MDTFDVPLRSAPSLVMVNVNVLPSLPVFSELSKRRVGAGAGVGDGVGARVG